MQTTFWDKRAEGYDANIKEHDSLYEKAINRSRSLLTGSDSVLDFACASGEISLDIAPHVQRVQGIDLSAKMIELAQKKARDRQAANIKFDQIDLFDERLARHSFTAVIAFNIFHLVDDLPRVLARINELLELDGLLISQTPCLGERSWFFRSLIGLAQKSGWAPTVQNLRFTELETFVPGSNFEIIESQLWEEKDAVQWIAARKN